MTTLPETNGGQFYDKRLICRDCGQDFVWEAGEQRFFNDRGLAPTVRCLSCRKRRRAVVPNTAGTPTQPPPQPIDTNGTPMRWADLYPTVYRNGGRQ